MRTTYDWHIRGHRLAQTGVRKPRPADDIILLPSYKEGVLMEMLNLGHLAGQALADAQDIKEKAMAAQTVISDAVLARAQELAAHGKVIVPLPTDDLMPPVIEGWQRFMEEPEEYKRLFTIDFEKQGDPDDGYISRDGRLRDDGVYDDKKKIFHYRPRLIRELRARAMQGHPIPDAKYNGWLLSHCARLYFECVAILNRYAPALDAVCPGFHFHDVVSARRAEDVHALRLLAYDKESARGKGHTDKSFLTLHIAESHPGLRTGDERTLFVAHPGEALLFFGEKAEILTAGRLKALWHEVTDERPAGDTNSRWSAIFFGHIIL